MRKASRIIAILIMIFICIQMATGCSGQVTENAQPELSQIQSICNLATLECYYHNVAKSVKEEGTGITHIGEKDRDFWIEYTGIAKIGIDMSRVRMEINGDTVTIYIPEAQLLDISIREEDLNEDCYISSDDALNKNKITAEDQTVAINNAQKTMEKSVKENKILLLSAQNRAKELIENYVSQMGDISGIEYKVKWEGEKN